jgi:DNA-binding NtrC family response regulator
VLLTDMVMPGGNGQDLAELLAAERPTMRVIQMSGYDSPLPASRPDGRFRFLAKPFGADGLVEAVRLALQERRG